MTSTAEKLRQQATEMRRVADELEKSQSGRDAIRKALQPYILEFLQAKHQATAKLDEYIDAVAAHERAGSKLIDTLKGLLP